MAIIRAESDRHNSPPAEGDEYLAPTTTYETDILHLSRNAYQSGKDWFDASARKQIERNTRAFNSQHPAGSKYFSEDYRKKSKIFRPKTKAAIRKQAAATAIAFFSSSDLLHCSAVNDRDDRQRQAAELHMAILQLRLERPEMAWFATVIGAIIDASVNGCVVSKQEWRLSAVERLVEELYVDQNGREFRQIVSEETITEDRPTITLIPVENIFLDPGCDWRDPINTSPYIIELMPLYVGEIKQMMKRINPITRQPFYRNIPNGLIAASIHQDWDSIRKARAGDRIDKYDNDTSVHDHSIAWVHRHIMKVQGKDYCWDTLGVEMMLSEVAQPIETVYLTGKRPYVMGTANIEPHKTYPAAIPEMIDGLQEETNDIANQRIDNVKLALNKRYYAKRGSGIDVRSLLRNVAGSVTFMSDPENDVKTVETRDVTSSSYAEQDRLNLDIDEVLGEFSSSSVASNRKLNETVGGMQMLQEEGSPLRELAIRTFSETWVEPVMRQLVELEAVYETDQIILVTGGASAGIDGGIDEVLKIIAEPIKVKVNVGFDSTNPQRRVQRLAFGLTTIAQFAPMLGQNVDGAEIVKEVMGALGYKDGARFYPSLGRDQPPAREQELMQRVQQLEQYIQTEQYKTEREVIKIQKKGEVDMARDQVKYEVQMILANNKDNMEAAMVQMKDRLEQIDRMIKVEESKIKRQELFLQREALSHEIQEADRRYMLELRGQSLPEGGAKVTPGGDKGGALTRDQFGLIPGMAG